MFWDTNVTETLPQGAYLKVCNEVWRTPGAFDKVAYLVNFRRENITEEESLKSIMMLLDKNMTYEEATNLSRCQATDIATTQLFWRLNTDVTINWKAHCPRNGPLISLLFNVFKPVDVKQPVGTDLDEQLGHLLLSFKSLQSLDIFIIAGQLPPQLGALSFMQDISIGHNCLTGAPD